MDHWDFWAWKQEELKEQALKIIRAGAPDLDPSAVAAGVKTYEEVLEEAVQAVLKGDKFGEISEEMVDAATIVKAATAGDLAPVGGKVGKFNLVGLKNKADDLLKTYEAQGGAAKKAAAATQVVEKTEAEVIEDALRKMHDWEVGKVGITDEIGEAAATLDIASYNAVNAAIQKVGHPDMAGSQFYGSVVAAREPAESIIEHLAKKGITPTPTPYKGAPTPGVAQAGDVKIVLDASVAKPSELEILAARKILATLDDDILAGLDQMPAVTAWTPGDVKHMAKKLLKSAGAEPDAPGVTPKAVDDLLVLYEEYTSAASGSAQELTAIKGLLRTPDEILKEAWDNVVPQKFKAQLAEKAGLADIDVDTLAAQLKMFDKDTSNPYAAKAVLDADEGLLDQAFEKVKDEITFAGPLSAKATAEGMVEKIPSMKGAPGLLTTEQITIEKAIVEVYKLKGKAVTQEMADAAATLNILTKDQIVAGLEGLKAQGAFKATMAAHVKLRTKHLLELADQKGITPKVITKGPAKGEFIELTKVPVTAPEPVVPLKPYPKTQEGAPQEITLPSGKVATKYQGSPGSNAGGFYKTADGEEYFVKFPSSTGQVGAEHVSADLARQMGMKTKDYTAFMPDEAHVASASPKIKFVELTGSQMAGWKSREELADQFVHAAWTRNWDVAGLEYDNLVSSWSGDLMVVDYGGSFLWRAQGALKADGMPKAVGELKTLRDYSNPQAGKAFSSLTDEDIARAVKTSLSDLDDEDIIAAVARGNFDPEDAAVIEKGLIERKKWLDEWADKTLGPDAGASPDQVKKALLGSLPNDPDSGIAWKPNAPNKDSMAERYTKALEGDTESLVRMGRRLWVGTSDVEQNKDLSLRFLQAAWQTDPDAVKAELLKFPETMKPVLSALEKRGVGQLSTHAVRHQIVKEEHLAALAKAKAEREAAEAAAKAAAELRAKQAEMAAAKAAYDEDLAAWQVAHDAWKEQVGKRFTTTGDIAKAYEKKVQKWEVQLRTDEKVPWKLKQESQDVSGAYETKLFNEEEWVTKAKWLRLQAANPPRGPEWSGHDLYVSEKLKSAKRVERRHNKNRRAAEREWSAEIERIASQAGLLGKEPVRPKPPLGLGGVPRPAAFHKGRAIGESADDTLGHPEWHARQEEMRRIGRELGYSPDRIEREISAVDSAVSSWKGSASSIRRAQNQRLKGIPDDQIVGDLKNAKALESELWRRSTGHDGDIWRGETFVDDASRAGGRSAADNEAWLKNHLETNVGSTWQFPYSQGFSTKNGFEGKGFGGDMPIQYHIRGKSSYRSFAHCSSHWDEREGPTREGATYLIESFQWFDTPNSHGHRVHINLIEVFDDGTTGID
jgi:hypothetical protein